MNAKDIIKYGHLHVLNAIEKLSGEDWLKIGVTTNWSAKDVMAHLASYEHLLEDALNYVLNPGTPTPYIEALSAGSDSFNDNEIAKRKDTAIQEILAEYNDTQKKNAATIEKISPELLRQAGAIPWYGSEYSLDDFIVYASYGHKEGHVAQLKRFQKQNE
ncbi:MAG: DinB family protein, partial [bacterium]|nr:DinB family protein [bacterium]